MHPYSNRLTSLHYDPGRSRDFIFAGVQGQLAHFGFKNVPLRPETRDRA